MLPTMPIQPYLVAGILGILSHITIFIRGEWHIQAPTLVKIYFFLALLIFYATHRAVGDVSTTLDITGRIVSTYVISLFTSIVIYRRYFHRLRHFPGPWVAGITKLWHVWQCRTGKNHLVLEKLQKKYGRVIRTGPEELTIIDAAVPPAVDGPRNGCTKAVWYDFLLPEVALNTTRSLQKHDARRRIWNRGFTPKALAIYEERVVEYAETLASRIEQLSQENGSVNVSDWFYWFTFDVMGEFAFARSFDMLRDEKWHFAVQLLRKAMGLLGPLSPVPWIAQIGFYLTPWIRVERPDVSHWLIEASLQKGSLEADRAWLDGDAVTIIIAGRSAALNLNVSAAKPVSLTPYSDTIAPTLVFAFYELALNPTHQNKLLSYLVGIDIYDHKQLETCAHLTAIINETLRLHPPVPTGGYRQSPATGMTINGTYIPGNVTIVSPRYSLGRLESSYEIADQFIPERWTTRTEMVKDARGFAPFSQGRFNCVGKNLAMSEMRFVIALLIKRFEVGFGGDNKGEKLFADLRDQFTAAPGRLDLQFRLRK
ncbi:hypothetical protein DL767_000008 [Monosporascus sp. MG133]|nr:hypothetical protein DL767_000008 [Monosporascus sp. MG133]